MKLKVTSDGPELRSADPEFRRRIERYAALRAARRAMAAPLALGAQDDAEGDTIRKALEHFVANPPGDPNRLVQELGGLDTVLARYARSLRARFAEVPVPQLRATLPAVARRHREEVLALVELLLEDEAEVERNLAALDFLFTLLCFEEGYGRRQIARDPSALSPRIRKACERRRNEVEEAEVRRLELQFFGFAELDADRADVEQQIHRLREVKRELGSRFLHPRILRAVVTYNVAVWNRLERFLESEREADPDWDAREPNAAAEPEAFATARDASGDGSFLEHPVAAVVALAVKRRLAGEASDDTLTDRIAWRLDLSGLGEAETELLRTFEPAAALELQTAAVLAGLLLAAIPVAADELEEAGLDPRALQFEWVREIDGKLRKLGKSALAERELERACEISETRTRFIHEPLLFISKTLRDHYRPPVVEGVKKPRMRGIRLGQGFARDVLRAVDLPVWKPLRPVATKRVPAGLAALLCALALLVGVARWWTAAEKTIREFDSVELAGISIFLDQGYRDRHGEGPLFVGRLADSWEGLSPRARRSEAEAIVAKLRRHRVSQVMIYGRSKTLEVQYLAPRLLRPPSA